MPAEDCLRLDDQEGRTPLAPNLGKPNPEEAITGAELRPRMEALINGQLLPEGEILQGKVATKFDEGNEYRNGGK